VSGPARPCCATLDIFYPPEYEGTFTSHGAPHHRTASKFSSSCPPTDASSRRSAKDTLQVALACPALLDSDLSELPAHPGAAARTMLRAAPAAVLLAMGGRYVESLRAHLHRHVCSITAMIVCIFEHARMRVST
jgi:hypothetical protein